MVSYFKKGDIKVNPERMQLKGMLAESKKNYQLLDTEASGLVILIRTLLNPYAEVKNLDTKKAFATMQRLDKITEEMNILDIKIKKLESELE